MAPDHKLHQRQSDPSSKSNAPSSAPDAAPIPASSRSATPVPHQGPSVDVCVASKVSDPVSTLSLSASPPATSSASLLGGRGKCSVSSSFPASEQGPPPAAPECLIVSHSLSPSGTRSCSGHLVMEHGRMIQHTKCNPVHVILLVLYLSHHLLEKITSVSLDMYILDIGKAMQSKYFIQMTLSGMGETVTPPVHVVPSTILHISPNPQPDNY